MTYAALEIPGRDDLKTVVFHWSTKFGSCYECGLPAAYRITTTPSDSHAEALRCSVCAAMAAYDGEIIEWLFREE